MYGTGLHFNRNRGDDRFHVPAKNRRNFYHNPNNNYGYFSYDYVNLNHQKKPQFQRAQSGAVNGGECRDRAVISGRREPENRTEGIPKPMASKEETSLSNLKRFLEAVTPTVPAQYFSKTTMTGLSTCGEESQPYFTLSDLWGSLREWSAYGVGVPLVLDGRAPVVQYYVPYLSGIQLFIDPSKSPVKSRLTSEDSDDYFSRDPSSDGSSDSDRGRGSTDSMGHQNLHNHLNDISLKMERLLSRRQETLEDFSSEEGESVTSLGSLLFQYLEHGSPYGREPLTDKMSDLALQVPELNSLRSCDLVSTSWLSVAWYPIYRIPTGPTLKDLDACFLTYHSLHTPIQDAPAGQAPVPIYLSDIGGSPRIFLPAFGLASYKFRGSSWTSSNGSDGQLVSDLWQAADSWLKLLQVSHPDFLFFCRNRRC